MPEALIEREIAEAAAHAGLRLRFDRVALRVVGSLRGSLAGVVAEQEALLFTLTAPIRQPARTVAALDGLARNRSVGRDVEGAIHGNGVRLRWLTGVPLRMPKVLGFVHSSESDPRLLLELAAARLRGSR